jgi:hypothetical protein
VRSSERLGTRCFFLDLLAIRSASGGLKGIISQRHFLDLIIIDSSEKIKAKKLTSPNEGSGKHGDAAPWRRRRRLEFGVGAVETRRNGAR